MGLATLKPTSPGARSREPRPRQVDAANEHGLGRLARSRVTVNGAFFGSRGAEAGGVFDYASNDNEDGAFRGAFGGNRTD